MNPSHEITPQKSHEGPPKRPKTNIRRSVLSNWTSLVAEGVLSILITPFMIHHLGDFAFGIYTLAFSAVGYFDVLTQGIRSTLQRFVGRLSGATDRDALNSVFSTSLAVTIVLGAVIIAVFLGLSAVLPAFFKLKAAQQQLFAWLVILLGVNLGTGVPTALLGSYLCGLNRFDLYNIVSVFRQALRTLLIWLVLLRGHGVIAVGVCVLISTLVSLPLSAWMIRRIDPEATFATRLVSLRTARELLVFSFWTLLNNAGQLLRDSTDSIVIGRVLNAALITPFTVGARLVTYIRPIITGLVSPLLPRMSRLDGEGRNHEMREIFINMTRLSALVSLAIGAVLILHGRTLLLLWVGPRYVSSYSILVLLTVGAVSSTAQLGTPLTLIAKNRHRAYGIWTIGEGLANLILSVFWAHRYGIVGVALGTAVPLLAVKLTLQPWYVTRVMRLSLIGYFVRALARPLAACGLFIVICGMIGGFQANGSISHLLLSLTWQGALLLVLAYAIGLTSGDRKMIRSYLPDVARLVRLS